MFLVYVCYLIYLIVMRKDTTLSVASQSENYVSGRGLLSSGGDGGLVVMTSATPPRCPLYL